MTRKGLVSAIRTLGVDAVQKASSSHPGALMGMTDTAEVLWNGFLHHNPTDPTRYNRGRLILSSGRVSMLLYSLLYLPGYGLSIEELKDFRQLHLKTLGRPGADYMSGAETMTGPLGQGLADAVDVAIAEHVLAVQFNQPDHEIADHSAWVFMGDGCLMRGVSHEAYSPADTLRLGKLIGFYDYNGILTNGETNGWLTDDTAKRSKAYHWHVVHGIDGHDLEAVRKVTQET